MGRIPHGIRLGLDEFKRVYIERRKPGSPFRQELEKDLERMEAIFADNSLDRAFRVIDRALKTQPESQQMTAGWWLCGIVKFRWDSRCLPKETETQVKKRHREISRKIQELTSLLKEELSIGRGSKDGDFTLSDLADLVKRLTTLKAALKKGIVPLFEYEFPMSVQRITKGTPDNIFFYKLVQWFQYWTDADNLGLAKDIFVACLRLDQDWAECEQEREAEDMDDVSEEIDRRAESARRYWYNGQTEK